MFHVSSTWWAKAATEAGHCTKRRLQAYMPDALFAGRDNVVEGLFEALQQVEPRVETG
jgi:DNA-binding LacI/PurR family transcriptional regulator